MIKAQILWDFRALDYMRHDLSDSTKVFGDHLRSTLKTNQWFTRLSKVRKCSIYFFFCNQEFWITFYAEETQSFTEFLSS